MEENCTCPIDPNMTLEQLQQIVRDRKMCTDVPNKRWMCPTLDRALVKARKENYWRKSSAKKLKRAGYSNEEIERMPRKKKGYIATTAVAIDLSDL